MSIGTIMVIGAGQMGRGIVQVAAEAGKQVRWMDISSAMLGKGIAYLDQQLERSVAKGIRNQDDKSAILSQVQLTASLQEASECELVIEAIAENMSVKQALFRELDEVCTEGTILATNTSSLPITEIAAVTSRASHVIGMHFMNPVPVMRLVEVIRGLETTQTVYDSIVQLSLELGKTPVEVQDFPGFVSNRILMPMINEAVFTVYEGVATAEAVDTVMKLGMRHPMGPLELADLIGLDTCLAIMDILYEGFKDSKYRPCPLLRKYVKAGRLGRKSGQGFYTYT
ncbi:3-hydroxybutyryl-CoA dehydrogenase [Paenibacillus roseipurpureus]|uniref:3-hydroxybutyryl-CoA dehydrogenase n=1 Tax=Paenibacillus roseopurpureus TaxID=2918901 RepID=A0AA96LT35_9BACL|nr:3-hydroxybutyryl-CoA dehydrogenase [Paenibacillus sp. MBLB1832]WNR46771.1 3-hydroxybutyryl-CoA dehydrogenase [Paenibacillus sp. MBLB1832]